MLIHSTRNDVVGKVFFYYSLLSSMVYEEPVSPTSEEVEDFLSSQPRHPQPTAPPLTAPAPTPAQTPDQPPVVEFGDDSTAV